VASFFDVFRIKSHIYMSYLPHSCYIPRPSHSHWFHNTNRAVIFEGYKVRSSKLCNFLNSVISFLSGSNILVNTLLTNTHGPCCFLRSRDQV
jgi:hypothetical protein